MKQDDDQPDAETVEHKSLDGTTVTVLHRIERYTPITTQHIATSGGTPDVDDFTEFFDSISGGEAFIFNDGNDRSAKIQGKPTRKREALLYNYSFRIRLL